MIGRAAPSSAAVLLFIASIASVARGSDLWTRSYPIERVQRFAVPHGAPIRTVRGRVIFYRVLTEREVARPVAMLLLRVGYRRAIPVLLSVTTSVDGRPFRCSNTSESEFVRRYRVCTTFPIRSGDSIRARGYDDRFLDSSVFVANRIDRDDTASRVAADPFVVVERLNPLFALRPPPHATRALVVATIDGYAVVDSRYASTPRAELVVRDVDRSASTTLWLAHPTVINGRRFECPNADASEFTRMLKVCDTLPPALVGKRVALSTYRVRDANFGTRIVTDRIDTLP